MLSIALRFARPARRWTSAEIRARGRTTPYRHIGRGPPLLVLTRSPSVSTHDACRWLARRSRVLLPTWPAELPDEHVVPWLLDVLDALGCDRTQVAADATAIDVARRLAKDAPDRVLRVRRLPGPPPAV